MRIIYREGEVLHVVEIEEMEVSKGFKYASFSPVSNGAIIMVSGLDDHRIASFVSNGYIDISKTHVITKKNDVRIILKNKEDENAD